MVRTSSIQRTDEGWVARAAVLARKAEGWTSPNPPVGAIVVSNGCVVGHGYHKRVGSPHAEREALDRAGIQARGATLYVTLEPCCHTGRTPPCTDAIIKAGIQRVVGGIRDPNPRVSGRGFEILRSAGIDVIEGIQPIICARLIDHHRVTVLSRRPFFHLKLAVSLDGRIAPGNQEKYWLTGLPARRYAHRLRSRYDAVLVGIDTLLKDDPGLDIRFRPHRSKQPHVIILDSRARTPENAAIFAAAKDTRGIILLHTVRAPADRLERLQGRGITAIQVDECENGRISIPDASEALWSRGIFSVLVEGGGRVAGSFIRSGLTDRISFITAPLILGIHGLPAFPDLDIPGFKEKISLEIDTVRKLGRDILIEFTGTE